MKTKQTKVEGKCYIWANPKTKWEIEQDLKELGEGNEDKLIPFAYSLSSNKSSYHDSAVRVHEFDVVGTVPPGIDLVAAAIKTLRTKVDDARKEFEIREADLETQIRSLALITYQPE